MRKMLIDLSIYNVNFFKLYAFILLTSTLVPGINYFVVTTHPLHQLQVRKRSKLPPPVVFKISTEKATQKNGRNF